MKSVATIACLVIFFACNTAHSATVLITGADRGLGLEFAKQYAARGDVVIATCRAPERATDLQTLARNRKNIEVQRLDVTSDADISSLVGKYKGTPIDVLINNAGVLGARDEQSLGTLSRKAFHEVMDVNALAPLRVSEALRDNVSASVDKKIIAITSGLGTIAIAGGFVQGPYYYRMSKAALNMGMQALGADLKSQGVIVASVSPGIADTDMVAQFYKDYPASRKRAALPAAQSVARIISVIDKLDQAKAARGVNNFDGTIIPW